jgi:hypothetical protein
VLAMMVHQDRQGCAALLTERGAVPDDPATVRAKAAAAR